jgi:hypothetical protein
MKLKRFEMHYAYIPILSIPRNPAILSTKVVNDRL